MNKDWDAGRTRRPTSKHPGLATVCMNNRWTGALEHLFEIEKSAQIGPWPNRSDDCRHNVERARAIFEVFFQGTFGASGRAGDKFYAKLILLLQSQDSRNRIFLRPADD